MFTSQALECLKKSVENVVGCNMKTSKDFTYLADKIFQSLHQNISESTLKRIWGYVGGGVTPRRSSLDVLAQFVGETDWIGFCQTHGFKDEPSADSEMNEHEAEKRNKKKQNGAEEHDVSARSRFRLLFFLIPAVIIIVFLLFRLFSSSLQDKSEPSELSSEKNVLRKGQRFASYEDFLKLFDVKDTVTKYYVAVPNHPHILLWAPEYHHPNWHNDGNPDSLLPTITEYWTLAEPATDIESVQMEKFNNSERYFSAIKLNEIRLTFMKNLQDTCFVFLGAYNLSKAQSNTSRIVWERVADTADINHLEKLESLLDSLATN